MQYVIDMMNGTRCRLSITATASDVKSFMDTALRDLKKEAPKGFTLAGAAKDDPLLRRVAERAVSHMASVFSSQALREADKHPVARPWPEAEGGIALPAYGQEFKFVMLADVLPDIPFPDDFSALALEVREPDIPPAEVFRSIERLMRPLVKLEAVTDRRLPANGDVMDVSVEGDIDGMPVPGLKKQEMSLPLDSFAVERDEGTAKTDLSRVVEKVARGLHVGEEGEGVMLCPENYPLPSLRGKPVRLKVTLRSLRRREVPSLTDETAVKLGYPDAGTLKTKAYTTVMNRCVLSRREEANEALFRMLPGLEDVEVPESLQRIFLAEYMADMKSFLRNTGVENDPRMKEVLASSREEGQRMAEENAKRHVYLLAYAYKTGISIPEKDVDEQVRMLAVQAGKPVDEFRKGMEESDMLDSLEERMMAGKAMEKIYAAVKKVVVDAEGKPVPVPERS